MSPEVNISSPQPSLVSPPVTVLLTVILLVFFFVGFFSIYFCRCFVENVVHAWNLRRTLSGNLVRSSSSPIIRGLDPKIKQSFPSFAYSSVKGFRQEKYGLECAICLAEFTDDDMLRLLTVCCHVFHQECIDLWLESHKTCPVCRGELDVPLNSLDKSPTRVHGNPSPDPGGNHGVLPDAYSIAIRGYDHEEVRGQCSEEAAPESPTMEPNERNNEVERFSRSHSTGHSILRSREEDNKYTLRLPEHVKIKITGGHNPTGSCTLFGEFSGSTNPRSDCLAEVAGCSGGDIHKV